MDKEYQRTCEHCGAEIPEGEGHGVPIGDDDSLDVCEACWEGAYE